MITQNDESTRVPDVQIAGVNSRTLLAGFAGQFFHSEVLIAYARLSRMHTRLFNDMYAYASGHENDVQPTSEDPQEVLVATDDGRPCWWRTFSQFGGAELVTVETDGDAAWIVDFAIPGSVRPLMAVFQEALSQAA